MAVIGCGRIGRMHARNLARHGRVRLVSVFDPAEHSARETATELGVKATPTVDDIWSDSKVEAVLIASPTDTHVPLIATAVASGKAVLCEKPIDLDLGRARAGRAAFAGRQPPVMLAFNRRFDPSFRALRERLHGGEIGRLELAIITSRDPAPPSAAYIKASGGLFRDMTIHDFDMARYLAGDIEEVFAFGSSLVDPQIGQLGDIDTCTVTLKARSGAQIQINNSRRCSYGYDQRVEVFGSKGMLQAGNQRATAVESWNAERTAAHDPLLNFFIERYRQAYDAEVDEFVAAIEGRSAMSPDYADGVAALELADAALRSLKSRAAVKL
jgi:myo-inositol 2-dehydrogenase/D-chiro-inositol 1-dehydrogenase